MITVEQNFKNKEIEIKEILKLNGIVFKSLTTCGSYTEPFSNFYCKSLDIDKISNLFKNIVVQKTKNPNIVYICGA